MRLHGKWTCRRYNSEHCRQRGTDGLQTWAYLAVIEVLAQTFPSSTNATVWAMVDFLFTVVVPQLANVAIVACSLRLAVFAGIARLLGRATRHAQHVLCHLSVQIVVLDGIVAMSTRVPTATLEALHLDIALVVLAAKDKLSLGNIVLVFLGLLCAVLVVLRSVGRAGVPFAQVVRCIEVGIRGGRVRRRRMYFREERLA